MYDICMNQPHQGNGYESYLDVDSAITDALRLAWEKNDRKSTVPIRDESGDIEAIIITDAEGSALVRPLPSRHG